MASEAQTQKFYSARTQGFYSADVHGNAVPDDAVKITHDQWAALLTAQSAGKQIVPDATGHPIAVDPVASLAMKQEALKAQMSAIEGGQNRALREHALGVAAAADRLRSIDQQIAELRAQLAALS